ncbi:MAG: hypothetical protein OQL08_06700 [Gammaproteobacteria bacterium]|nr:hypothetical protein [Gammaproteobacteria bacterium]
MHSVNIHINENVTPHDMGEIYQTLMTTQHVRHVELHAAQPHDLLVEFEEHHDMPMHLLQILQQRGLHADIVGC